MCCDNTLTSPMPWQQIYDPLGNVWLSTLSAALPICPLFSADVQGRLDHLARDSGRRSDELVQDAVIGLIDESGDVRSMLDRRYDDIENGTVQPIVGETAYQFLMARTHERRTLSQR